jgi:hypothetical protein
MKSKYSCYKLVTDGTCESHGMTKIYDLSECQAAGNTVGKNEVIVFQYANSEVIKYPAGCSWHQGGNLELRKVSSGNCDVNGYHGCFCKIDPQSVAQNVHSDHWIHHTQSEVKYFTAITTPIPTTVVTAKKTDDSLFTLNMGLETTIRCVISPISGSKEYKYACYVLVTDGTCESHGLTSIHDLSECQAAGDSSGKNKDVIVYDFADPTGCYWHQDGKNNGCFCKVDQQLVAQNVHSDHWMRPDHVDIRRMAVSVPAQAWQSMPSHPRCKADKELYCM